VELLAKLASVVAEDGGGLRAQRAGCVCGIGQRALRPRRRGRPQSRARGWDWYAGGRGRMFWRWSCAALLV